MASLVDKAGAREFAQWWDPGTNACWDAAQAFPLEGADAATSAWVADQCNNARGQELDAGEQELHEVFVEAAKERELVALKRPKVLVRVRMSTPPEAIVDTLRVLSWKMVEGTRDV